MVKYRLSGEGYTDEEMRVLKHMCKDTLADINEFMRKKEEKKKKERKENPVKNRGRNARHFPPKKKSVNRA